MAKLLLANANVANNSCVRSVTTGIRIRLQSVISIRLYFAIRVLSTYYQPEFSSSSQ